MKVLIIRFSSIGDVTQALSLPAHIKSHPKAMRSSLSLSRFPSLSLDEANKIELHFLSKQEFSEVLSSHPDISRSWFFEKKQGLSGLFKLALQLRKENFTHIYDAHNNLRSRFVGFVVGFAKPQILVLHRKINRWHRFLLLKFKINKFKKPFSGQRDLLEPLQAWGVPFSLPPTPQIFSLEKNDRQVESLLLANHFKSFVVLVPSAAYELKRWPLEYFQKLIDLNSSLQFVILAGPHDHFAKALQSKNVLNLTGKTTLGESLSLIKKARAVVANDTGLMHFAEQLGIPTIALMGPAPFGFPSREKTLILKRDLSCWPCSKHGQGPCVNASFHLCLRDISPQEVSGHLQRLLTAEKKVESSL